MIPKGTVWLCFWCGAETAKKPLECCSKPLHLLVDRDSIRRDSDNKVVECQAATTRYK